MAYIFDPDVLRDIARGALTLPLRDKVARIRADLSARYPGHVRSQVDWVFNNAGGAMGQMCIMHASLTEYVLVFGTPIGTEGYSGRFAADDYFTIIHGEQWAYAEGDLDRHVYREGDTHHLPRGRARGYRIPDSCYALEYARGWIPQMLPFGLADSFSSTLDLVPVLRTMRIYARAVVGELLQGKI